MEEINFFKNVRAIKGSISREPPRRYQLTIYMKNHHIQKSINIKRMLSDVLDSCETDTIQALERQLQVKILGFSF